MGTKSVEDLVREAQSGDSAAFGALYEHFAPEVSRYIRRRTVGSVDLVEDLTSGVFLKILEHLQQYQEQGVPFQAWLYRIVRNHLIDHVRAAKRHAAELIDEQPEPDEPSTSTVFENALDRHMLEAAITQLSPAQQQVIRYRFYDVLTAAETADLLGNSVDAVKKLQARALLKLGGLLTARSRRFRSRSHRPMYPGALVQPPPNLTRATGL